MSKRRPAALTKEQQDLVTAALPRMRRLARRIARRWSSVPLQAILDAGHLALVLAALAYDRVKNDCFDAYWLVGVRGAMLDAAKAEAREATRFVSSAAGLRGANAASEALRDETSVFHGSDEDDEQHILQSCALVALGYAAGVAGPALALEGEEALVARQDRARELDQLHTVLALLPERDRKLAQMRFVEGRPVLEVAELLGVSKATVERCCARMVARLSAILDARGIGRPPKAPQQPQRVEAGDAREAPPPAPR